MTARLERDEERRAFCSTASGLQSLYLGVRAPGLLMPAFGNDPAPFDYDRADNRVGACPADPFLARTKACLMNFS